jgi:hypothetical protein
VFAQARVLEDWMLKIRKLSLNAETLRVLTHPELRSARGAAYKATYLGGGMNACSYTDHDAHLPCPSIDINTSCMCA